MPRKPDLKLYANRFSREDQQIGLRVYRSGIGYDLKTKRFRLQGNDLLSDPKHWQSTGAIVGIPDLAGAQMFVLFRCSGAVEATDQQISEEIQTNYELETLTISMSPGRRLRFNGSKLQKHTSKFSSCPIFSFTFPNTSSELKELENLTFPSSLARDRPHLPHYQP